MSKIKRVTNAYEEILQLLYKYKDDIAIDVTSIEDVAHRHLFGVKLVEEYGFKLDPKIIKNTDYQELMANVRIAFFDGINRLVTWEDNGRQPHNELLLYLSFPTGPYVLGAEYPTALFKEFMGELQTYGPKYIDSHNYTLYFSMEKAAKIHNAYPEIFNRYRKIYADGAKERRAKKLREELAQLESE